MQRLNDATLPDFVAGAEIATVLFGAPHGEASLDQAHAFAEAWVDQRHFAAFGYIDAFANISTARAYGVRILPTTFVLRDGDIVAKLEGRNAAPRIVAAIARADTRCLAAA